MPGREETYRPLYSTIVFPDGKTIQFPQVDRTGNGWVKVGESTYGRGQEGFDKVNRSYNTRLALLWEKSNWERPTRIDHTVTDDPWNVNAHSQRYFRDALEYVIPSSWGWIHGKIGLNKSYYNQNWALSHTFDIPKIMYFWKERGEQHFDHYGWSRAFHPWKHYESGNVNLTSLNSHELLTDHLEYIKKAVGPEVWDEIEYQTDLPDLLTNIEDYLPSNPNAKTLSKGEFMIGKQFAIALTNRVNRSKLMAKDVDALIRLSETLAFIGVQMDVETERANNESFVAGVKFTAKDPDHDLPHVVEMNFATGLKINCGYVSDEKKWLDHQKRNIAEDIKNLL